MCVCARDLHGLSWGKVNEWMHEWGRAERERGWMSWGKLELNELTQADSFIPCKFLKSVRFFSQKENYANYAFLRASWKCLCGRSRRTWNESEKRKWESWERERFARYSNWFAFFDVLKRCKKKIKIKYETYFFFLMLNLPFRTKGKIRERERKKMLFELENY